MQFIRTLYAAAAIREVILIAARPADAPKRPDSAVLWPGRPAPYSPRLKKS
jgi:hypothetical protein